MKKLFTLVAVALATVSANAQEKSWTFENWETADYTADFEKDGLTIHASNKVDDKGNPLGIVSIDASNKTINVDGKNVKYTMRLKLNNYASSDGRYISFTVDGPSEITVVYTHSSSNDTYKRVLNFSYGNTYDVNNLHSLPATPGVYEVRSVRYELNEPNTINIGSGAGGINIYGIYVKDIVPTDNGEKTAPLSWDFTKALSDADVANLDIVSTEDENATASDDLYWYKKSTQYSYLPTLSSSSIAIDNFYGIVLKANGKELEQTKGLRFGRVVNGSLSAKRIVVASKKYLGILSEDNGFIIPDLKRNDVVKIKFATRTAGNARTLLLTNAYTTDECTSSTTTPQEVTCTVLSDGYVGFRGTEGLNYYSITVNADVQQPDAYQLATEDTGYYSLYLDYDAIIPEGITAYTGALSDDQTVVDLTKVTGTVLKRNRGYIVKSNAVGTFSFEVSGIMGDEIEGNELKGVTVDTDAADIEAANEGKTVITLGLKDGIMGFRKPANGMIEANKAYLLTDTPPAQNQIIAIRDNGGTTEIGQVQADRSDKKTPVFNLAGQRVGSNFKGIVLINGKKVIRK